MQPMFVEYGRHALRHRAHREEGRSLGTARGATSRTNGIRDRAWAQMLQVRIRPERVGESRHERVWAAMGDLPLVRPNQTGKIRERIAVPRERGFAAETPRRLCAGPPEREGRNRRLGFGSGIAATEQVRKQPGPFLWCSAHPSTGKRIVKPNFGPCGLVRHAVRSHPQASAIGERQLGQSRSKPSFTDCSTRALADSRSGKRLSVEQVQA